MDDSNDLTSGNSNISLDFIRTYKFFYGFLLLALVFVVIGGWNGRPVIALLWSFACLASGAFVGFLFGIPRVLQQDNPAIVTANSASSSSGGTGSGGSSFQPTGYTIRVNTNLEQISDWLTKIIVGITLVELQSIRENLNRASEFIAYSIGGQDQKFFAGAILVFFSIGGFLGGYLFTRLFLTGAFYRAEQPNLGISRSDKEAIANSKIPVEHTKMQLTGTAAQAAQQVTSVGLDQLSSPSDIAVWAKAQLNAGNKEEAINGFSRAVSRLPGDVKLRLEYALALRQGGRPLSLVLEQLLEAYKRLTPETEAALRETVYEALIYSYLYVDPPEGFTNAIKYGEEYLNSVASPFSGAIYVDIAAAYAQKYAWYKAHPDESVDLAAVRNQTLDAVKAVLAKEPQWRERLRLLLDSKYPKDPAENDLEVFESDPEFRALLGLPPIS
ncbi:MAG: hypothetical protein QOJ64_3521 [Acidobacteriota bacterium]|jgi:hypothetical protein|nr:hypothetical protein [Acidobacteriota bacterium]